ncbi:hypothetical protein O181_083563 [Austropuccinia psidii MF-1]|uniref:Uncharacterized protein n=1 Tax=Austropuccinia psidii MF-1 TaxID=1389203 RepID=A0A9Q3IJP1_9BASI|nr:hypothetical protein [Austropuccinia psidii MF-1]
MSSSRRYKCNSEGSNRHIHEPLQLGNVTPKQPRSDGLLEYPENVPQRGLNSETLQWMESTIIQTSNQKGKGVPFEKEGGKQGRSPSSFY